MDKHKKNISMYIGNCKTDSIVSEKPNDHTKNANSMSLANLLTN